MKEWQNASEEDQQKEIEARGKWMTENESSFVDQWNPVGVNTRVHNSGEVTAQSNEICGYSVLSAESKENALELLKSNPHTIQPGAYIELMEIMEMEM